MNEIIELLKYEIKRPTSYGTFHLISLGISLLLIFILCIRKEKNHERSLKVILGFYGIIALILEVLKQIIWSYNNINGVAIWDYQWYAFPFQLCTTPIIVSIICLFLKKNNFRTSMLSFMAFFTILGSLATAIYPESCFVETLLVDIHTMYLHLGALVVSIYLVISKEVKLDFKNLMRGYVVFLTFVLLAQLLNIYMYNSGLLNGEVFNMFYISPFFESSLPIYNTIQSNFPYLIFLLIYLISIFIGGLLIYSLFKVICYNKVGD